MGEANIVREWRRELAMSGDVGRYGEMKGWGWGADETNGRLSL